MKNEEQLAKYVVKVTPHLCPNYHKVQIQYGTLMQFTLHKDALNNFSQIYPKDSILNQIN